MPMRISAGTTEIPLVDSSNRAIPGRFLTGFRGTDQPEGYRGSGAGETAGERIAKVMGSALAIPDMSGATMLPSVKKHVLPESIVYTDELRSYHGISHMTTGCHHKRIHQIAT